MSLIIGEDDFGEVIKEKLNFIDKSLFIQEIFDNRDVKVSIIIRPRRFGKTLNMSMLRHFLASEVNRLKTEGMFDHLKIAKQGDHYMQHQGKYPVIFISFKNVKTKTFSDAYKSLLELMSETYTQYDYLLSSPSLPSYEKNQFENILIKKDIDLPTLENSLKRLSSYLFRHHGVKPWLLIDEYDTPIQAGYVNGYYEEVISLIRGLLGAALKGNDSLHRAVVTGILRIARENLFSDLNNLQIYSVLDFEYADHFGFIETEVDEALKKNNLAHLSNEIKSWYNGYHIGNSQIYNPWSIASCVNKKGALKPYWVNTSENSLIKKLLAQSSADFKKQFELVLNNQVIDASVDESLVFSDLDQNENAIWSLLLFSGYLTATSVQALDDVDELQCTLQSPNQEISALYRSTVRRWFIRKSNGSLYRQLLQFLVEGDLTSFLPLFQKILLESTSYFDATGQEPEKFYHGFVLGLVVSLSTHTVHSNKESGLGRYDVVLIPNDKTKLGIVLEFKVAKSTDDLQNSAADALSQINAKNYAAELTQQGISNILKIGLAFSGKEVAMASGLE